MVMLKDFRAFQLSKNLYQQCKPLKMPVFLKDQLLRASSSVALDLAESNGNRTDKERIRFFTISLGSLRECEAILELENVQDPMLTDTVNQLGAILFKLCGLSRGSLDPSLTLRSPDINGHWTPDSDPRSSSP
jgi:four helix bundle protein